MRAIFHLHTTHSGDSLISIPFLLENCVKKQIDLLFITEHNNMDSYPIAKQYIKEHNLPLKLIPSEEIATQEGEVIGIFLKEAIPARLSLQETITQIREQGGLIAVPHPFDRIRKERIRNKVHLETFRDFFDMIEVFNARSSSADNKKAQQWAEKYEILPIWGADAHFKGELGNCIIEIEDFDTPASFLKALSKARVLKKRHSITGILKSGLLKKWRKVYGASK